MHSIQHVRKHFGVLNDASLDKLRKLGLLSGPKKNLTTSLKFASTKVALMEVLRNLKNSFSPTVKMLQSFVFGLPSKPLRLLSHYLQKLMLLEIFILQLKIYSSQDFSPKGIAIFGNSFKKMRRLKKLYLYLEGKYTIPQNALLSFGRDLHQLQDLRELTLGLPGFTFTLEGIKKVFKALNRMSKLEILHINIADSYCMGDKGLREIADALMRLKQLRSFYINFSAGYHVEKSFYSKFMENLIFLNNLKSLDLVLVGCSLGPEILLDLGKSLHSLKKLATLKMNFYSNNSLSPQAYGELWEAVGTLENLEVLEIRTGTMGNIYALENKGLEKLGKAIERLTKLIRLNITLRGSAEINNEGALRLGTSIMQVQNLEDVEIHFMQFQEVTEEVLASLKEMLDKMPKMKKKIVRF